MTTDLDSGRALDLVGHLSPCRLVGVLRLLCVLPYDRTSEAFGTMDAEGYVLPEMTLAKRKACR